MKSWLKHVKKRVAERPRRFVIAGVLAVVVIASSILVAHQSRKPQTISYSRFISVVSSGKVAEVKFDRNRVIGTYRGGGEFSTLSPSDPSLVPLLIQKGINIETVDPLQYGNIITYTFNALMAGLVIFFLAQYLGVVELRRTKLAENHVTAKFEDVAGIDEVRDELLEIVELLRSPEGAAGLGARLPKGVLLTGPPGTGKTLMARAVAGESDVPFISTSGADFDDMFVGSGKRKVQRLFKQARRLAPCIVFIDEIDAVGRKRSESPMESRFAGQTLNQLLIEMDGIATRSGVVVLASTNQPEVLDAALLRPGRFDRQVAVQPPDMKGREAVLKVHTKGLPLGGNADLTRIARGTPGFTGADLANLVNEAALSASRKKKKLVEMEDFETAKDKVMMGVERRGFVLSDKEKRLTAYHEAGHALGAKLVKETDPLHKVSIIPRGRALGVTVQMPQEDKHCYTSEELHSRLVVLMAGRAAEKLVFGTVTTGAGNDIAVATSLARKMICDWGLSEKLGPMALRSGEEAELSESVSSQVDAEVRRLIEESYQQAQVLLASRMDALNAIAEALLDRETIVGEEIDHIVAAA